MPTQSLQRFRELLKDLALIQERMIEAAKPGTSLPPAPQVATMATYIESLEGLIRVWSPEAEALYGYAPEDVLGREADLLCPQNGFHEGEDCHQPPILPRVAKSGEVFFVYAVHRLLDETEGLGLGYRVREFRIPAGVSVAGEP